MTAQARLLSPTPLPPLRVRQPGYPGLPRRGHAPALRPPHLRLPRLPTLRLHLHSLCLRPPRPRLAFSHLLPLAALLLAALVQLAPSQGHAADAPAAGPLAAALDATLVIYSDDMDEAFLGSGFLWGDGLLAVTNQHVVGGAHTVELRTRTGRRLSAPVIARDEGRDIALIAVADAALGPGLQPAATPPALGTEVFALGAPLGAEFTATRGVVSATGRQVEEASPMLFVQHDAAVNPGSSGGPLVDARGRLVGMNSQIADGSRLFAGIAYAVGATDLQRLVPGLASGELRPVPRLGLRLRPVSRRIAAALDIAAGEGLLIDAVEAESIAARGGLRPGDVLLAFGPDWLTRPGELARAIEARSTDRPELLVLRDGLELRAVLDLRPPPSRLTRLSGPALPERVESYSFEALGMVLEAPAAGDGTADPGILVAALTPTSPAAAAGLVTGDRILEVNGRSAAGLDLAGHEVTGPLLLLVARGGSTLHVVVDPWSRSRGAHPVGGANVLDPEVASF